MQMPDIFQPGNLIRINDFQFSNGETRDKYLIVLCRDSESTVFIYTLTTSVNQVGVSEIKFGCSVVRDIPFFTFTANKNLGPQNYYFDKDTFIFFKDNIRQQSVEDFENYISAGPLSIHVLENLSDELMKRILKCIIKSRHVPLGLKQQLKDYKDIL